MSKNLRKRDGWTPKAGSSPLLTGEVLTGNVLSSSSSHVCDHRRFRTAADRQNKARCCLRHLTASAPPSRVCEHRGQQPTTSHTTPSTHRNPWSLPDNRWTPCSAWGLTTVTVGWQKRRPVLPLRVPWSSGHSAGPTSQPGPSN